MKNLSRNSETIATISWLLMDFCWTSEYMIVSWIFSIIALSLSIVAVVSYMEDKKSERYILLASLMWVTMNSLWMWGEDLAIEWLSMIGRIFFLAAAAFIIFSLREARREGNPIDLKRLKIK